MTDTKTMNSWQASTGQTIEPAFVELEGATYEIEAGTVQSLEALDIITSVENYESMPPSQQVARSIDVVVASLRGDKDTIRAAVEKLSLLDINSLVEFVAGHIAAANDVEKKSE